MRLIVGLPRTNSIFKTLEHTWCSQKHFSQLERPPKQNRAKVGMRFGRFWAFHSLPEWPLNRSQSEEKSDHECDRVVLSILGEMFDGIRYKMNKLRNPSRSKHKDVKQSFSIWRTSEVVPHPSTNAFFNIFLLFKIHPNRSRMHRGGCGSGRQPLNHSTR